MVANLDRSGLKVQSASAPERLVFEQNALQ